MRIHPYATSSARFKAGLTLIEMTVVILVLLGLTGGFFVTVGPVADWQKGRVASSILRDIEVAQRQFLADHPQRQVSTLTVAEVSSYLPGSPASLPTMVDLDGNTLVAKIDVSPPVAATSSGQVYDPSANRNDSLWDVGQ